MVLELHARSGAMWATGVMGATGVVGASHYGTRTQEMEGWKREGSYSTARLSQQCGYFWDFRLYGNNAFNYLYAIFQPKSTRTDFLDTSNIKIDFNNGVTRLAPLQGFHDKVVIGIHPSMYLWLPLPSKADFKGSDKIDVTFNIFGKEEAKSCTVKTTFHRNPHKKVTELSVESRSTSSFSFGYGAMVSKPDSLAKAQSGDSFFDVSFNGYFNLHHGMGFSLIILPLGEGNSTVFSPLTGSAHLSPDPHFFGISLGYTYRNHFLDKWNFVYDLHVGYGEITYENGGDDRPYDGAFITYQKLSMARRLYRVPEGFQRQEFYLGLSLNHIWIVEKVLSPLDVRGHILAPVLFARWEY